jgi:microcystin-dependent protein
MADPFVGEIRLMSFNFAPQGWALCNGQTLLISQNQALFSLLGTTYGGNGQTTFALPDLRSRVPLHMGGGHTLGEQAGTETVTLTQGQLPAHNHRVRARSTATGGVATPNGNYLGGGNNVYGTQGALTALSAASLTSVGGSQPHNNLQPYLTISFCIALQGIFPSQN